MSKRIDISGHKFGRLTVIKFSHVGKRRELIWLCRCDCGESRFVVISHLISGHSKSCGCLSREKARDRGKKLLTKHGMHKTVEYQCWISMRARCINKKNCNFKNYGARGISVSKRWMESFEAFYADMGDKPSPKHSIDRINNDGNYEPSNCRWADKKTQSNNQRGRIKNDN